MAQNPEPLRPRLDQAQQALVSALADACSARLDEADTGEMIRVEEVLAIANEAAKEVISVRRRLHKDRRGQALSTESTARRESASESSDTHREIEDAKGVRWMAFAVYPSRATGTRSPLPDAFQRGWLAFDSGLETRRLTPIPDGWRQLPDDELCRLCETAKTAPRRTPPRP
jgi:hypothetical protein